MLFAARHHEECNCSVRKGKREGRHGEEIGPRTTGKEGRIGKRRKRRSEEACRRWKNGKVAGAKRTAKGRSHRNGRKTSVNIQTEQSICPAETGNAHRGACSCVFSFVAPSGRFAPSHKRQNVRRSKFFLSHVTFGIARSSCLSKPVQPKGTIP